MGGYKNQYIGGNGLKRGGGGLGQFADLRGAFQKRGGSVFWGVDTPMYIMIFNKFQSFVVSHC